jgi:hypothetical protein
MHSTEPFSIHTPNSQPRHPHQEIADLLATALLRLRQSVRLESDTEAHSAAVGLGFCGQQSVNGNTHHTQGARP